MRELKFRGKTKENKIVYGSYVKTSSKEYIVEQNGTVRFILPNTVQEYTGYTDVNGEEIYCEEILYDEIEEENCTIEFLMGGFKATYECFTVDLEEVHTQLVHTLKAG